ncbi:hypothetical protein CR513_28401, partial [Mucuna pruriens]
MRVNLCILINYKKVNPPKLSNMDHTNFSTRIDCKKMPTFDKLDFEDISYVKYFRALGPLTISFLNIITCELTYCISLIGFFVPKKLVMNLNTILATMN